MHGIWKTSIIIEVPGTSAAKVTAGIETGELGRTWPETDDLEIEGPETDGLERKGPVLGDQVMREGPGTGDQESDVPDTEDQVRKGLETNVPTGVAKMILM